MNKYTTNDHKKIIDDIRGYIEQTTIEEQKQYIKELNDVKDDFIALVNSGIFHDAIGKVKNIQKVCGKPIVEVVTEY